MSTTPFQISATDWLEAISGGPCVGTRWFKADLHVHSNGLKPADIVSRARAENVDIMAITEHQTFGSFDDIAAAAKAPGRPLTVLPGIEITSHEGAHILALFPGDFAKDLQLRLIGWLGIARIGDTNDASTKTIDDILNKIDLEGGITIVPHPFTGKIGLLDSSRKVGTKVRWLESGHIRLIQAPEDKVRYIAVDDSGNWINRFVLESANAEQIQGSRYCLAPFNRSDCHSLADIGTEASWFRMAEPSIAGLKQVACEPKTRISRTPPSARRKSALLAVRVAGGYCDGQTFRFSEDLTCIIGPNYAGKSAVFDFIRFGLQDEILLSQPVRNDLLGRLNGILGDGSTVELAVRQDEKFYLIRRTFEPIFETSERDLRVVQCASKPKVFLLKGGQLVPENDRHFDVEVYEQGRINRLRGDLSRQLDMLDEFAGTTSYRINRELVVTSLGENADKLAPLYQEREELRASSKALPALKEELKEKQQHLPGEDEKRWEGAARIATDLERIGTRLKAAAEELDKPVTPQSSELLKLFSAKTLVLTTENVSEAALLSRWSDLMNAGLSRIRDLRVSLREAVNDLAASATPVQQEWREKKQTHDAEVGASLAKIGIESPMGVVARVAELRNDIGGIENEKLPRLKELDDEILLLEEGREGLLRDLRALDEDVSRIRQTKAAELTDALEHQIEIQVERAGDQGQYADTLNQLCDGVATRESQIKNRDLQLEKVRRKLSPLDLSEALRAGLHEGKLTLARKCDITENTERVLTRIVENIHWRNSLETVVVPDRLLIRVRRQGEQTYSDLSAGLSPGEQSAALLSLALETRGMPLLIDQPEDELGYRFVVHLIVPKLLRAKFSRQILIVTHNANVPVLGDADYVFKMENQPQPPSGRRCVVAVEGCFESPDVTTAMLELEGGPEAFRYRQHRYGLRDRREESSSIGSISDDLDRLGPTRQARDV